jgi:hypothetical protein
MTKDKDELLPGSPVPGRLQDSPSTPDDTAESWVRGVSNAVTITGHWEPMHTLALDMPERRRMRLAYGSRELFGIEWWSDRTECDVCITGWDDTTCEAMFSIVSEVIHERAEWWRRWGYAVIRHLPEAQ